MKIINGKKIAHRILEDLKKEIKEQEVKPRLAVILVGDNSASHLYVKIKEKTGRNIGVEIEKHFLSDKTKEQEVVNLINSLNKDNKINGILVQLPLPEHISEQNIIKSIPLHKDVDGFHPHTWGKMMTGEDTFLPCTPAGIQEMLIRSGNNPEKKHVVIAGRSKIVGLPLANILIKKEPGANATVTVCHTGTQNMSQITKQADILIAAIGRPEVITADVVNENAVVIDVGVNRVEAPETERGYRLVGDVHFETVSQKVKAISPVPGGVGPMTIIMLMKNTVKAAKLTT